MKIKKQSPFSGQWNVREIDVTDEQLSAWENGTLIQNAMPHLSTDDREFIMTGITPEEWTTLQDMDEMAAALDEAYRDEEEADQSPGGDRWRLEW